MILRVKRKELTMRVLLICESSSYGSSYHLIENPSDDDLEILRQANGKMINVDEDAEVVNKIYDFLCSDPENCEYKDDVRNCQWSDTKIEVENGTFLAESIDLVCFCGWYD